MPRLLIFLILSLYALSCSAQPSLKTETIKLDKNHILIVLDSAGSSTVLLQDKMDNFFDLVTASEMSIQMKKPLEADQTREDLLPAFQAYLRRDVSNFTKSECKMVSEVMQGIFKTCNLVSPAIFPEKLILIKTKGNHYGKSVYYTRENTIVIPDDVLAPSMRDAFESTMYHELFHVFSRLNPEPRKQLYKLIGFENIGYKNLEIPENLAARLLFNPDGVDFAQRITLKLEGDATIEAIPVIYSKHLGFKSGRQAFFGYVEFNLFQVEPTETGKWKVITKDDGYTSTLNLRELPDFFRQIKDNTGYIIHPDEVLADNFSFLMREKNKPDANAKFSAEGKKLISDMESILAKTGRN